MPNYFYFDKNGQKQGPINDQQLQALAAQRIITPESPLETGSGHKGRAGQISGLKFPAPPRPATQSVPVNSVRGGRKRLAVIAGTVILVLVGGWWMMSSPRITTVEQTSAWSLFVGDSQTEPNTVTVGKVSLVVDEAQIEPSIAVAMENAYVELKGLTDLVNSTVFSPDGNKIVTGSSKSTQIWDAATGEELKKLDGDSAIFSPDGKKVVTVRSDAARIWDVVTGEELKKLEGGQKEQERTRWETKVVAAVFSLDGKKIATGNDNHTVKIWDAETGEELKTLNLNNSSNTWNQSGQQPVAFSSDGKKIVTGSRGTAQIWNAETGSELRALKGEPGNVTSENRMRRRSSGDGLFEDIGVVASVVFSPDGTKVITAGNSTVRIWDAETGEELRKLEGDSAVFSPDGKKVVTRSSDKTAKIWDAETGKELQKLEGRNANKRPGSAFSFTEEELRKQTTDDVNSATFSSDGTKVITAGNSTVRIWDAETGEELRKLEGDSAVFSPDSKKVVTKSRNKTARVWDLPTVEKQEVAAAEAEAKRIADHKAILAQTGAVDFNEELSKSGFRSLSDFLQFGSKKLNDDLKKADAFDKPDIEAQIRAAQEDLAKETFYGEYTCSAVDVKVAGEQSCFTMIIPAGFIAPKIGEVAFPISGVTVKGNLARRLTAPIIRSPGVGEAYAFLLEDDKILPVLARDKGDGTFYANLPGGNFTSVSNNDLKNAVTDTHGKVLYTRHGNPSSIVLSISGSTAGIREFGRNIDSYRARVWFKNMRYSKDTKPVEYWLTNTYWRKDADVDDKRYDNPFVTTDNETVETISADVLKIEIIKK